MKAYYIMTMMIGIAGFVACLSPQLRESPLIVAALMCSGFVVAKAFVDLWND